MSDQTSFLERWDWAIATARVYGECERLWASWHDDEGRYNLRCVARTMHPSFMGGVPPKYDPSRDMPTLAQAELVSENPEPHQVDTEWVRPKGYLGPNKNASPRCESGGRDFCTCDVCF